VARDGDAIANSVAEISAARKSYQKIAVSATSAIVTAAAA